MVRQRQELIRLPDVSKMIAEIKIEESRVGQVRAGMTAYQVKHSPAPLQRDDSARGSPARLSSQLDESQRESFSHRHPG
jgi:hypothetical protein